MLVRKLLVIAAVVGILTITGKAFAQDEPEKPKTLIERLDAFGKTIFGGILPAKKSLQALEHAGGLGNAPAIGIAREGARVVSRRLDVARRVGRRARRPACGQRFGEAAKPATVPPTTIPL